MLSWPSRMAMDATRLRHLVYNLWWAERPVVFLTCVPQCWQVIKQLLIELILVDCFGLSGLHSSCLVFLLVNLLLWRFLAFSFFLGGNIKINSVHRARGWVGEKRKNKIFRRGCQDIFWRKNIFFSLSIYSSI